LCLVKVRAGSGLLETEVLKQHKTKLLKQSKAKQMLLDTPCNSQVMHSRHPPPPDKVSTAFNHTAKDEAKQR
jgi:hypothetical protein